MSDKEKRERARVNRGDGMEKEGAAVRVINNRTGRRNN